MNNASMGNDTMMANHNGSNHNGMNHNGMDHNGMDHNGMNMNHDMGSHNSGHHGGGKPANTPSFSEGMSHSDPVQKLIESTKHTHIAVKSGAWSDPKTWSNGRVPGDNAKVLIKKGTTVTYDLESEARIKVVSIEGTFKAATGKDTQLKVETMLNGATGQLQIGSAGRAVDANRQARFIFTSDSGIDKKWDPKQLSKGLVSHGTVDIYGADKADKVELVGDAKAGTNVLRFKDALKGWRVGDRIVLGGTDYTYRGKDADNSRFQDEVLTITSIKGKEIRFVNEDIKSGNRNVLRFDHTRSTLAGAANKLSLYAGNMTRNVSFETENGKRVPIDRRAHVMLMHNPNVKVVNAGFYELGRTDKTKLIDDPGKNVDGSKGFGRNPRGRYALHIHRTGTDDINGQAALLKGNAIAGSPGWGIAHHDSHAIVESNFIFDVVGSGIAAEAGNEIGSWTDNLTIKTTGVSIQQANKERTARERRYDFGSEGTGFWVQGAGLIKHKDNTAISSNHAGLDLFGSVLEPQYFVRDATTLQVKNLPPEIRKLFPAGQKTVDIRDVPMATVSGFESYNASVGLRVWSHSTNFDGELAFSSPKIKTAHEGRSLIENFKVWGNRFGGAFVEYSSNIDLKNGLVLGRDGSKYIAEGEGLRNNQASYGGRYDNLTIAGFQEGVSVEKPNSDKAYISTSITNSTFTGNGYNLGKVSNNMQQGVRDDFAAFVEFKNNKFHNVPANKAPTARFSMRAMGGLAVELDAGASQDVDPLRQNNGGLRDLDSNGIAGYGWDLNGDGTIDEYGRKITHVFDKAGNKNIVLTVLDSHGEASSAKQMVKVQPSAYVNAFADGDFGRGTKTQSFGRNNSQWADEGWYVSNGATIANGVAKLSKTGDRSNFIGQVTRNDGVHRGQQTLSFSLKNLEGGNKSFDKNETTVALWGINGQFDNMPGTSTGPLKVGGLPMQRTALANKSFNQQNGGPFDWKNISMNVNLGKGYDYLMFEVSSVRTDDARDYVAIDNVSLAGKANSIGGNPTPTSPNPATLNPTNPNPTNPNPTTPNPANPNPPNNAPTFPTELAPVVHLAFDEQNGNMATDTSTAGMRNSGQILGNVDRTNGSSRKFGKAVTLDGKRDLVSLNNSRDINLGTYPERTVSVRFRADDVSTDEKQVIYEEGGGSRGLNMYLEDGLLHVGSWGSKGAGREGDWATTQKVQSGKWHHVALVLDGEGNLTPDALSAYLDGSKFGSAQASQMGSHPGRIGIGNTNGNTRFADGASSHRNNGLAGSVDELQIFNDALSGNQIRQLSNGNFM